VTALSSIPPTYDDVLAARARIAPHTLRTPLLALAPPHPTAPRLLVKLEPLQRTGSFKFRGASNAVRLAVEEGFRHVVACSSGNHAQGVAEAARLFGIAATIVMPADAPPVKRRRTEASGARVIPYDRMTEDRDALAARVLEEEGGRFVHPYEDPAVIAGQGTLGLEIAEDCDALGLAPDAVLVPCSGGGLTAGVSLVIARRLPGARIYAVEPEGFDDYARSLAAGTRLANPSPGGSVCDALLARTPGRLGFEVNRPRLAGALAVSDEAALRAVGFAFERLRVVVEPGGAVALAAALEGLANVPPEGAVVVVLSGGNVEEATLARSVAAYRAEPFGAAPPPA